MTRIHIDQYFNTREDAEAYRANTERRYPPEGYGTFLTIHPTPDKDGVHRVSGYRYSSCD